MSEKNYLKFKTKPVGRDADRLTYILTAVGAMPRPRVTHRRRFDIENIRTSDTRLDFYLNEREKVLRFITVDPASFFYYHFH